MNIFIHQEEPVATKTNLIKRNTNTDKNIRFANSKTMKFVKLQLSVTAASSGKGTAMTLTTFRHYLPADFTAKNSSATLNSTCSNCYLSATACTTVRIYAHRLVPGLLAAFFTN